MSEEKNVEEAAAAKLEEKQPEVYIDQLEGSTTRLPDEPEPVKEVKKGEDPAEELPPGSEGLEPEVPAEPKEAPKPGEIKYTKAVEKRIGDITREKNDAIRDAGYWKGKALEKQEPKPADPADPLEIPGQPKEEDFDTTGDFVAAYSNWDYGRRKTEEAATDKKAQDEKSEQDLSTKFYERVDASGIKNRVENYEELISSSGTYSPAMKSLVMGSEQGPELALYLAQNTEVSQAISKMSPMGAAKEIGKLEIRVTQKPTRKTVTSAADPIKPLTGNDVPAVNMQTASQHEYEKARGFG